MSVLFVVVGTPLWDQPPQIIQDSAAGALTGANLTPVDSSSYAATMAVLAKRYASKRVAWELWNEPDNPLFFSTTDPAAYAQLACDAFHAIKAVAPNVTVVAGALARQDPTWLSRAYAAGLHGCFDVLSIHPYDRVPRAEPANWQPPVQVGADRQIMVANGDAAKPIWITEFGWYADPVTTDPVPEGGVTLAEQAKYTSNFINEIAKNYRYVTTAMVYNGIDAVGNAPDERYAGILTYELVPKKIYYTLAGLYDRPTNPGTTLPDVPFALALPLCAIGAVGGILILRRRRRAAAPVR